MKVLASGIHTFSVTDNGWTNYFLTIEGEKISMLSNSGEQGTANAELSTALLNLYYIARRQHKMWGLRISRNKIEFYTADTLHNEESVLLKYDESGITNVDSNGDETARILCENNHTKMNVGNGSAYVDVDGTDSDSKSTVYANDTFIEAEADLYLRGGRTGNSYVGWIHIDNNGDIFASGTIYTSSDERLKKIVATIEADIDKIAKARIVDYYFKADKDKKVELGSIAQDWQDVFPNAVRKDKEGHLSLDYSAAALASAVTAAKEIAKLKEENENLKRRLSAIEEKLGINK
jgi:hypothetical protein